jgi:hypothetical protein
MGKLHADLDATQLVSTATFHLLLKTHHILQHLSTC